MRLARTGVIPQKMPENRASCTPLLGYGSGGGGGSAFPYFWLALLAIWLFSIKLGWFPESGGYDVTTNPARARPVIIDDARHSRLPAMTILVASIGGWILTMRNNKITVLAEGYVRMARAKGLSPWRIMWTYAGGKA